MPTIQELIIQGVFAFVVLFILTRIMGKRQIAQLTFFDYVVALVIGDIAATWSMDDITGVHAVCELLVWTLLALLLAWVHRKFYFTRVLLDGRPTIVIEYGNVLQDNLKKVNLTIDEMMLLLREKDVFKLSDVEYAIFEINGKISVMKKADLQPVTPKDMGLQVTAEHTPHLVIMDGQVIKKSLTKAGCTEEWLLSEIKKQGAMRFSDVFVAQVDSHGNVYANLYNDELITAKQKA